MYSMHVLHIEHIGFKYIFYRIQVISRRGFILEQNLAWVPQADIVTAAVTQASLGGQPATRNRDACGCCAHSLAKSFWP